MQVPSFMNLAGLSADDRDRIRLFFEHAGQTNFGPENKPLDMFIVAIPKDFLGLELPALREMTATYRAVIRACTIPIAVTFAEWDDDPRELDEIPEVARFAAMIFAGRDDWQKCLLAKLEPETRLVCFRCAEATRPEGQRRVSLLEKEPGVVVRHFFAAEAPETVHEAVLAVGLAKGTMRAPPGTH